MCELGTTHMNTETKTKSRQGHSSVQTSSKTSLTFSQTIRSSSSIDLTFNLVHLETLAWQRARMFLTAFCCQSTWSPAASLITSCSLSNLFIENLSRNHKNFSNQTTLSHRSCYRCDGRQSAFSCPKVSEL